MQDGAYLVPLRVFVGLGWLRASTEKIIDPAWWDGSALSAFLAEQVSTGAVPFPAYAWLIENAFLPWAAGLGVVVLLGQLLSGLGITFGALTKAALLNGLFLNLNFLLAGVPNPSAFYVVIQTVLLLTNAGMVLGIDGRLAPTGRSPLVAARTAGHPSTPVDQRRPAVIALLALVASAYALLHVRDWSPVGSVEDSAMILAILCGLGVAWCAIVALGGHRAVDGESRTSGDDALSRRVVGVDARRVQRPVREHDGDVAPGDRRYVPTRPAAPEVRAGPGDTQAPHRSGECHPRPTLSGQSMETPR